MGNQKHIGLRAQERQKLCKRRWLYPQPETVRQVILDECICIDLAPGESAIHLGDRTDGLYGLIDGWL